MCAGGTIGLLVVSPRKTAGSRMDDIVGAAEYARQRCIKLHPRPSGAEEQHKDWHYNSHSAVNPACPWRRARIGCGERPSYRALPRQGSAEEKAKRRLTNAQS